jgi:PPOX class probable F420-dependent enzyme
MAIAVNRVLDVADGPQPGQFEVGDRSAVERLDQLDPVYRELLDGPVTAVISVIGSTGVSHLSPVWFDYEGELVLLNLASHRKKVGWLRKNPRATFLLMNPQNPYHWVSIKTTVSREIAEDDAEEGPRVTAHIDRMFARYGGGDGGYSLRDPGRDERRILVELRVDSVATFGRP